MSARYPYLKKAPFLIPIAWGQRIGGYLKERAVARAGHHHAEASAIPTQKGGAAESLRLGKKRVTLLKKYGIIR